MKLARFDEERIGVVVEGGVVDVTATIRQYAQYQHPDPMRSLIQDFAVLRDRVAREAERGRVVTGSVWLPPLREPGKIIGAATNYQLHAEEMVAVTQNPVSPIMEQGYFLKAPSSLVGPGAEVCLPFPDRRTDHEAELAVIVGRRGKGISRAAALEYVFGYCCLMDISVRGKEDRGLRKSCDTFTPVGPYIVTADEIPDPNQLDIRLWVDDEVRQESNTRAMIFDVPRLIEFISSTMTLEAGDIIATGTPHGVGPIRAGNRITIEVERVGRFSVSVR